MVSKLPSPRTLKNEQLADLYGSIAAKKAAYEEQLAELQKNFLGRGFASIDGKRYRLSRVEACSFSVLNGEMIKQTMDSDWLERMSKTQRRGAYAQVKAITKKRVSKPVKVAIERELALV